MSAPELGALQLPGTCDGIDVSQVQRIYNPGAVAAAGFTFAYVKASEGLSYVDPERLTLLKQLRDVGLVVSVYGFARPSQGKAREQAKKLLDAMGGEFCFRCALDLENAPDAMTPEELVAFAEEYVDEVLTWSPCPPVFYSFPYFETHRLAPAIAKSTLLARCALWSADYGRGGLWLPPAGYKPFTAPPWTAATLHQYSGGGGYRVPGIYGDCDRDLFLGDFAALRRFFARWDPEAVTQPELPNPASEPTVHVMPDMLDPWTRRDE